MEKQKIQLEITCCSSLLYFELELVGRVLLLWIVAPGKWGLSQGAASTQVIVFFPHWSTGLHVTSFPPPLLPWVSPKCGFLEGNLYDRRYCITMKSTSYALYTFWFDKSNNSRFKAYFFLLGKFKKILLKLLWEYLSLNIKYML